MSNRWPAQSSLPGYRSGLGTSCAVLTISELQALAETLERVGIPAPLPRVRLHLGGGHAGVRFSHSVSAMGNDASYVSEIYRFHTHRTKHDARTNRDIGSQPTYWRWGAVSAEAGQRLGGRWTARSRRTITGSLRRALALYVHVRPEIPNPYLRLFEI